MKPLRSALTAWEPAAGRDADPLLQIKASWRDVVGEDVAANSRPHELQRDSLLIVTRSGAWSQQLSFLSERILTALRERTRVEIERLRFRVGRVNEREASIPAKRTARAARRKAEQREAPRTLQEAVERFREDIAAFERAKAAAGWNECVRCGVRVLPASGRFCIPCANVREQERDATVARLLYEAPWLGYAGIKPLVDDLTPREYEALRLRLLRGWRDTLERVKRSSAARPTARDRMIASSYVLLKSELDPEHIAPAVVRDLLGDELHEIFYGNGNR